MRARTRTLHALSAAVLTLLAGGAAAEPLPAIDREMPFQCLKDGKGDLWRVQCVAGGDSPTGKKICVHAPNAELDEKMGRVRPLERALPCYVQGPFDGEALKAEGYTLVPGVADAPYGWMRDERNRVFQVNFDLHRRLYVGVAYAPLLDGLDGADSSRGAIDFSLLEAETFTGSKYHSPTRHRFSLIKGEVGLSPATARIRGFHWDFSRRYARPLMRITTFFPEPRRHDARVNLGGFIDALDFELRPTGTAAGDETIWRYGAGGLTADLWQSRDLYSYVRLKGGAQVDVSSPEVRTAEYGEHRVALTPVAGVEANLTLDQDGFHHILGEATYEAPYYVGNNTASGGQGRRLHAELGYEVIAIALNDQPLSLRVAGRADYRDEPGDAVGWDFSALAGLRFSLWAPARQR